MKVKGLEMRRSTTLILALSLILILTVWISLARCPQAVHGQDGIDLPDQNDVKTVMIALTRLDVNDQTPDVNDRALKLRWRIMNDFEHDIWICKEIPVYGTGYDEEVYLDDDNQTLLIRRRFDVPAYVVWIIQPGGTYIRLRPGEDWSETLSLTLPVHSVRLFKPKFPERGIKYARRLVVEIGYHTKDLPREVGRWEPYPDPNMVEEVEMDYYDSANDREHVLRITVDGVLIPYEELIAEPINTEGEGEDEP